MFCFSVEEPDGGPQGGGEHAGPRIQGVQQAYHGKSLYIGYYLQPYHSTMLT